MNVAISACLYPEHGPDVDLLIRHSLTALYDAVQEKNSSYRWYEPALQERLQALRWIDDGLRQALGTPQLALHYQPKVGLHPRQERSVEALIRWTHPERGPVRPDQFIARCEANGMIIALGRWILDTAAVQARQWHAAGRSVRIAVNISARQLDDPELLFRLQCAQEKACGLLDIELTESSVMNQNPRVHELLTHAQAWGFGLYLDDFGTGYSSLAVLAQLPLSAIKIDRVFVQQIGQNERGLALLRSMIELARALELGVVAEGVETQEQADFLRQHGVGQVQGWLYAPALPADPCLQWLDAFAKPGPSEG